MTVTYPDDLSMTDRKPDKSFSSSYSYNTAKGISVALYSKSKLITRRKIRKLSLAYSVITKTRRDNILAFIDARGGPHETFIFDLSHINESGLITMTFDEDSYREEQLQAGDSDDTTWYSVAFSLTQTYR